MFLLLFLAKFKTNIYLNLICLNIIHPKIACLLEYIWLGQAMAGISRDANSGDQTCRTAEKAHCKEYSR